MLAAAWQKEDSVRFRELTSAAWIVTCVSRTGRWCFATGEAIERVIARFDYSRLYYSTYLLGRRSLVASPGGKPIKRTPGPGLEALSAERVQLRNRPIRNGRGTATRGWTVSSSNHGATDADWPGGEKRYRPSAERSAGRRTLGPPPRRVTEAGSDSALKTAIS